MGHYASEIDPKGWSESISGTQRILEMRRRLEGMKLGDFTVAELEAVMRVMGLHKFTPNKEHFELLEKRLGAMKQPR